MARELIILLFASGAFAGICAFVAHIKQSRLSRIMGIVSIALLATLQVNIIDWELPDWRVYFSIGLASVPGVVAIAHPRRPSNSPGHCKTCGYNLTGNVSGKCSECGAPVVAP